MNEEGASIFVRDDCKFNLQKNSLFVHQNSDKCEERDAEHWKRNIPDDLISQKKNIT